MKNLLPIAVSLLLLLNIHSQATAQSSLKFIDGIEFKADIIEYSKSLPSPAPAATLTVAENTTSKKLSTTLSVATEACKALQFKYAQLLDVEIETVANLTMYAFVEDWWNARYRYGGTTRKGIDCSAFTGLLLSTVYGLVMPRTAHEQYAFTERIARDLLQEGDLVFFNTRGGVSHVGVYLANDHFVHASVSEGVTISSLNDPYYRRKYIGAGRMKSTEVLN
jgi:lipoprotein Spr